MTAQLQPKKVFLYSLLSVTCFTMTWQDLSAKSAKPGKKPRLEINSLAESSIEKIVTGVITGDDGSALAGASILVKGTTIGVTADADGKFSIAVPDDAQTLIVSFIGYNSTEVSVGNQSVVNVTLTADLNTLSEVVVTGYGDQKKSDFTGAVSTVKGEELTQLPMQRADQALQGRAAGVMVMNTDGSPGGNTTIRIRGSNSINGNNAALIVIDGLQGGDLKSLNPNDIESIEVLKDASATAIYGSQGANGVVIITTKKGKGGPPVFNYNVSYGVQQLRKKLDLMNAVDFANATNAYKATQNANGTPAPTFTDDQIAQFAAKGGTDWQDEIYRTGKMQNHQLSISGASDKVSYMVSGGYLNQNGILINSAYKRYSLRANINVDINKWSKFGLSLAGTKELGNTPPFGEGSSTVDITGQSTGIAPRWAPTLPVYDNVGNYILSHPSGYGAANTWNPVASAQEPQVQNNTNRNQINTFLEFKPLKGLSLRISGGAIIQDQNNYRFYNNSTKAGATAPPIGGPGGSARLDDNTLTQYQNTNQLTYDTKISKHHLTLTAVAEQKVTNTKTYQVNGSGYIDNVTGINDIGSAQIITATSSLTKRVINSYMGRLNYVFADKYAITASYRADGSSVFGANNKWGYFPSVGAAWSASEENFIKNLNVFSLLKLRGSWGITGNQSINPYQTIAQLTSIDPNGVPLKYPYDGLGASQNAYYMNVSGNPNLKWESTNQYNIGLDLGLFNGKLQATVEYYHKKTNDLLLGRTVPTYTGYSLITSNVGSMENKGIELSLNGTPTAGLLRWNTGVTFSANRNKVLSLGEVNTMQFKTSAGGGYNFSGSYGSLLNLTVGQPIGQMLGYQTQGTWNTNDAATASLYGQLPGDQKYLDVNNDHKINSKDITVIGNALPKFIFGWTNQISYKHFDLNLLIQGVYGNNIFNAGRILLESPGKGTSTALLNRWTPEHQNTDVPAYTDVSYRSSQNLVNTISLGGNGADTRWSRWVESGSYARLKNITLAYNLTSSVLGSRASKLRLYASAANLVTITKYKGYDPEVSSYNNNDALGGVDFSSYPTAKTYTLGIDLTF